MYEDGNVNQNSSNNQIGGYNNYNNSNSYQGAAYNNNGYRTYDNSQGNPYMNPQNNSSQGNTPQNNTYGYGNTSYSYNSNPAQQGYGTYQYSTTATPDMNAVPVKKKNSFAKVVAVVAIIALLVGGIGTSYYVVSNFAHNKELADNIVEEANDNYQSVAQTVPEEKKVETTTVTGETKAVVTDVTQVVQEVMPACVIIHNNYTQKTSFFGYTQEQEATASGSGIIVGQNDAELLVATNYHVVEGSNTIDVIFNDDTTVEAAVKGVDSDMDLAVIAIALDDIDSETLSSIKVATLGDSDKLALGEPAIAIGNALGYGQSVTTGVISALNRSVELEDGSTRSFIQTDAAINPGNSGGALLNLQGEVIGINSNKLGGTTVEGMGYAIPISAAKPIIEKLMNEKTMIKVSSEERGYIGISGVTVTSDVSEIYGLPQGVYIADITEGGGAAKAGIEKGDIIVGFDGAEISSMEVLQTKLQYYAAGTVVEVTVKRQSGSGYEEQTFEVTLGKIPAGFSKADTNASQEGEHYDGEQQPGMPEDRNSGDGQQRGSH